MTDSPTRYDSAGAHGHHAEILPSLQRFLRPLPRGALVLDAGCGNGFISGKLMQMDYVVEGIDTSPSGIDLCRRTYPGARFEVASASDPDLPAILGRMFDAIVATEVIEHLYSPRSFIRNCGDLLHPGGLLVLSTPYHGYLKNLLLALSNQMDRHLQPDHEGGHIKFWSQRTLTEFLSTNGFRITGFAGRGRVPWLWKTMVVCAVKQP